MNAAVISYFTEELQKHAQAPGLLRRVGQAVWNRHYGHALAGAVPGAAVGALATPEDRMRGALTGGLVGAGGGLAAPLLTRAGRKGAGEAVRRFGQSQWHGATGRGRLPISPKLKGKEREALLAAEKAGLTSIPGAVKGLATKPLGTLRDAWRHAGGLGKAFAIGDVALSAPRIADASTAEGLGEKTLGTLGSAGGYLLAGRMPILPSLALSMGAGHLAGLAGRGVDALTGHKRKGPLLKAQPRPTAAYAERLIEGGQRV